MAVCRPRNAKYYSGAMASDLHTLIHPEAECISSIGAYRTIFYSEQVFGSCIDLSLLNLNNPRETLTRLKQGIVTQPGYVIERDALISLRAIDWRPNLIGCGAMLVRGPTRSSGGLYLSKRRLTGSIPN